MAFPRPTRLTKLRGLISLTACAGVFLIALTIDDGTSSRTLRTENLALTLKEGTNQQSVRDSLMKHIQTSSSLVQMPEAQTGPAIGAGQEVFADAEWCKPHPAPLLPYDDCENREVVYKFGVWGGLTNALGFLMKGAIWAFEDGVCFTVDESGPGKHSPMAYREPPENTMDNFLGRYFEPIGLPWGKKGSRHPIISNAKKQYIPYGEINEREGKKMKDTEEIGGKRSIPKLGLKDLDNTEIKKAMLRRFWRLLPDMRQKVCSRLATHDIQEDYMAMSVRRGDKKTEYAGASDNLSVQTYIDAAEKGIMTHFGGKDPVIFVATDDCSAVGELRAFRPEWRFISECDRSKNTDSGFVLGDMVHWTLEETDSHYEKFFAELIGMAEAKYWIGVSFTNVSLWVYFMRSYEKFEDSWVYVDDLHATVINYK